MTLCLHHTLWPRIESYPRLRSCMKRWSNRWYRCCCAWSIPAARGSRPVTRPEQGVQRATAGADHPGTSRGRHRFNMVAQAAAADPVRELQIPVTRKTPTGQPSTAEDVLEELALRIPCHGSFSNTAPWPSSNRPTRTSAELAIRAPAASTRLINRRSRKQPAVFCRSHLQTFRSAAGRTRIRQAFIAPPGYVLMAADYSQIELRSWPTCRAMKGCCLRLPRTAMFTRPRPRKCSACPSTPFRPITANCETINFGLIYGCRRSGSPTARHRTRRRQRYVERYFARYPGVKRFMDRPARTRECGTSTRVRAVCPEALHAGTGRSSAPVALCVARPMPSCRASPNGDIHR